MAARDGAWQADLRHVLMSNGALGPLIGRSYSNNKNSVLFRVSGAPIACPPPAVLSWRHLITDYQSEKSVNHHESRVVFWVRGLRNCFSHDSREALGFSQSQNECSRDTLLRRLCILLRCGSFDVPSFASDMIAMWLQKLRARRERHCVVVLTPGDRSPTLLDWEWLCALHTHGILDVSIVLSRISQHECSNQIMESLVDDCVVALSDDDDNVGALRWLSVVLGIDISRAHKSRRMQWCSHYKSSIGNSAQAAQTMVHRIIDTSLDSPDLPHYAWAHHKLLTLASSLADSPSVQAWICEQLNRRMVVRHKEISHGLSFKSDKRDNSIVVKLYHRTYASLLPGPTMINAVIGQAMRASEAPFWPLVSPVVRALCVSTETSGASTSRSNVRLLIRLASTLAVESVPVKHATKCASALRLASLITAFGAQHLRSRPVSSARTSHPFSMWLYTTFRPLLSPSVSSTALSVKSLSSSSSSSSSFSSSSSSFSSSYSAPSSSSPFISRRSQPLFLQAAEMLAGVLDSIDIVPEGSDGERHFIVAQLKLFEMDRQLQAVAAVASRLVSLKKRLEATGTLATSATSSRRAEKSSKQIPQHIELTREKSSPALLPNAVVTFFRMLPARVDAACTVALSVVSLQRTQAPSKKLRRDMATIARPLREYVAQCPNEELARVFIDELCAVFMTCFSRTMAALRPHRHETSLDIFAACFDWARELFRSVFVKQCGSAHTTKATHSQSHITDPIVALQRRFIQLLRALVISTRWCQDARALGWAIALSCVCANTHDAYRNSDAFAVTVWLDNILQIEHLCSALQRKAMLATLLGFFEACECLHVTVVIQTLQTPRKVVWRHGDHCASENGGGEDNNADNNVGNNVGSNVGNNVGSNVGNNVGSNVGNNVGKDDCNTLESTATNPSEICVPERFAQLVRWLVHRQSKILVSGSTERQYAAILVDLGAICLPQSRQEHDIQNIQIAMQQCVCTSSWNSVQKLPLEQWFHLELSIDSDALALYYFRNELLERGAVGSMHTLMSALNSVFAFEVARESICFSSGLAASSALLLSAVCMSSCSPERGASSNRGDGVLLRAMASVFSDLKVRSPYRNGHACIALAVRLFVTVMRILVAASCPSEVLVTLFGFACKDADYLQAAAHTVGLDVSDVMLVQLPVSLRSCVALSLLRLLGVHPQFSRGGGENGCMHIGDILCVFLQAVLLESPMWRQRTHLYARNSVRVLAQAIEARVIVEIATKCASEPHLGAYILLGEYWRRQLIAQRTAEVAQSSQEFSMWPRHFAAAADSDNAAQIAFVDDIVSVIMSSSSSSSSSMSSSSTLELGNSCIVHGQHYAALAAGIIRLSVSWRLKNANVGHVYPFNSDCFLVLLKILARRFPVEWVIGPFVARLGTPDGVDAAHLFFQVYAPHSNGSSACPPIDPSVCHKWIASLVDLYACIVTCSKRNSGSDRPTSINHQCALRFLHTQTDACILRMKSPPSEDLKRRANQLDENLFASLSGWRSTGTKRKRSPLEAGYGYVFSGDDSDDDSDQ